MQRWEYRIADGHERTMTGTRQLLGRLGNDGWELVCMAGNDLIFKRPVVEYRVPAMPLADATMAES